MVTRAVRALRQTWGVREYIVASVRRDFVARYLGTQLGFFWAIAQPVAMITIFTLVFAQVMRPALPGHESRWAYSIYLFAGIAVWQLFSEIMNRSVGVFTHNANLLKKVSLPKFALPVIVGLSCLVNFAILMAVFVAFLLVVGAFPGAAILAMLPAVVVTIALALGLGVLLGIVNVFYRDVEQATGLVLGFWFWLTPIVYPARTVPDWLAATLEWNPLWPLVRFVQSVLLDGVVPDWRMLVYPAVVALVLVALGLKAFLKLGGEIVDEL
jgi:lipopolysaccharide transport system permease protein